MARQRQSLSEVPRHERNSNQRTCLPGSCSSMDTAPQTGANQMIDTPQITQTTATLTALIYLMIPRSELRSVMGPGISEVIAAVKAQGIGPTGPWFTHHLKMDPATFDFEICVPV